MTMKAKKPSTYNDDMDWVARRMEDCDTVWCVRKWSTGLILRFVAVATPAELTDVEEFEGVPVADLRVHRMYLGTNRSPHFGPECPWPRRAEEGLKLPTGPPHRDCDCLSCRPWTS